MSKPLATNIVLDGALLGATLLLMLSALCYYGVGFESAYNVAVVKDNYYRSEAGNILPVKIKDPVVETDILELPVKSVSEVVAWASQVGVQLFTVDFFNIDDQINSLREYFTPDGWRAMDEALRRSGWAASLVEKKLSTTAVLQGPPIVVRHGVLNGSYSWVVNFPVLVSYESASEVRKETRFIALTVRRVDADYSSGQAGIAISSFVADVGSAI